MNDLNDIWKTLDKNNIATDARMRSEISNFIKAAKSRKIQNFLDLLARFSEFTNKQRNIGVWLFGRLRNRKAVPLLLTLLNDENNEDWEICSSLGLLGGKKAIQGLKDKLEKEKDADTRRAIVHVFSFVGFDKGIAETLIHLAGNRRESTSIRALAVEGIGLIFQGCKDEPAALYKDAHKCLLGLRKNKDSEIQCIFRT